MKIGKKSKKTAVVTQKNLDESRDEVLARGKKFRYPFQYAKHRVMLNAILIGVIAAVAFVGIGWAQLYKFNNTGETMYRFTKAVPVSVATIDGVKVRYSDYLLLYRSSVASIERQQGAFDDSEDSRKQLYYFQREALNAAESYTLAEARLAERGESVAAEEIEEVFERHRKINGESRSEEAFASIVRANFGLDLTEYRRMIAMSLAKKKLSELTDTTAQELIERAQSEIALAEGDFENLALLFADEAALMVETVENVDEGNLDGGRAEKAASLSAIGELSEIFSSTNGDGYYIVKLTGRSENRVSYQSVFVRFEAFDKEVQKLRDEGAVMERITIEE